MIAAHARHGTATYAAVILASLLLGIPAIAGAAKLDRWSAYPVGIPGSSMAMGVNGAGDVAGTFTARDGSDHAFVSIGRHWLDLGAGEAIAINDAGQVAGNHLVNGWSHAFLYDPRTGVRDLGAPEDGLISIAYDLNNRGEVVGQWSPYVGTVRPFLYDETGMHDLGNLGGNYAAANAINDAGQIVGYSWTATETEHPFLYDQTGMHDLTEAIGAAAGDQAVLPWGGHDPEGLRDISNDGQILGMITASCVAAPGNATWTCRSQPYLFDPVSNTFRLLEPLVPGDFVLAVRLNDQGVVVGWGRPPGSEGGGSVHAVVWEGTHPRDLGTLGGPSSFAFSISNGGAIAGAAEMRNGRPRAAVLHLE